MTDINYLPVFPWALDFTRKVYEFGSIRRFLLRICLGRYAFREFVGMRDALIKMDYPIDGDFGYGLESCEYHKEKISWKHNK